MAYRKKKKANAFIDFETLGLWDDAVILTMGLTILTDERMKVRGLTYADMLSHSIELKYNVIEQVRDFKRKVEPSVLAWWKEQGPAASHILKPSPQDRSMKCIVQDVIDYAKEYEVDIGELRFFDRNAFDMKKLQHINEVNLNGGNYPPWDVQEVWGIETLLKFCSPQEDRYGCIDPKTFNDPAFVYHSAKCDAALDAYRFYKLMQGE